MATSSYTTTQYTSEQFVESCGAILFDVHNSTVCLIYYHAKNEWILAKGRRNCNESRHDAALRELREETGYQAHLHPVMMQTRAPPMDEQQHTPDQPRAFPDLVEPFMMTLRQLGGDGERDIKLIWWFIAALDDAGIASSDPGGEEGFTPKFFRLPEAMQKLTFQNDRDVLERAIALVEPDLS
ncbi:hypothetical protein N7492_000257 [Penicillium capsulatum]|uniref:Nudix hydrolase domain-containing protein n=1 Tax=Penicillium capsulatum TaxID=69766 RepID=A0A9W9IVJ6_9EURO|nr:hypothetical protein N7492_000257 [Penicillium capsulatum]KAJ6130677.1 hypothetical protein N7512_003457 [Penicillium capsulatum]